MCISQRVRCRPSPTPALHGGFSRAIASMAVFVRLLAQIARFGEEDYCNTATLKFNLEKRTYTQSDGTEATAGPVGKHPSYHL